MVAYRHNCRCRSYGGDSITCGRNKRNKSRWGFYYRPNSWYEMAKRFNRYGIYRYVWRNLYVGTLGASNTVFRIRHDKDRRSFMRIDLSYILYFISYIQSYIPPERTKKILGNFKGIGANAIGALLGTVTPFCSCSSIPIFMGFTRAGLSSGVTFSFLISSPLVDLGAFILLASVFGFPIAIAYVVVGLVLAIIGGTIIEKTGVGKHVQDFILEGSIAEVDGIEMSQKDRLLYAKDQMLSTLKKVWIYILVGVGIGATIHNFIPTEWIQAVLGSDKWYAVPLATILGTPMYADIFGTIPVAEALFAKGVGVGTILSFMMSVTALSLPSMIMLSKAVKPKLLFWFIFIVVIGIIIIGFTFNAFNFLFV